MAAHSSPLGATSVAIDDEFWNDRLRINRDRTLAHQYHRMVETGRIDNFWKAAGAMDGEFEGRYYNDSDVYKWVEAASNLVATTEDPSLESQLEGVVDAIEAAQQPDGYLNTYFVLERSPSERWTNLGVLHELYCAGHLVEAAIAHRRATGERRLLEVAIALADHVDEVFGPDDLRGYPGHEEIELALVELYRETGTRRYLDLASFFVEERGREPSRFAWELENADVLESFRDVARTLYTDEDGEYDGRYAQDHAPVREQDSVEGHAVRATYLYAGVADVATETGDDELVEALTVLWENMTNRRSYLSGGIGSAAENEGFTDDYDLPVYDAYAETCAAIGAIFWSQRMLRLTGESRYADHVERVLYNGFLAGVGLSGEEFFYVNPLASRGDHHRQGWFECACCPPNVSRLLASLDRYLYSTGEETLTVNQFVSGAASATVAGTDVRIEVDSDFPWTGRARISVEPSDAIRWTLETRVPAWSETVDVRVNGEPVDATRSESGYLKFEREWVSGDVVELEFDQSVERVVGHPSIDSTRGKVAFQRGPIVYCFEEVDNPVSPERIVVPDGSSFEAEYDDDALGGVVALHGNALAIDEDRWGEDLYRSAENADYSAIDVTAIPYYGWDHREPGRMNVWVHRMETVDRG